MIIQKKDQIQNENNLRDSCWSQWFIRQYIVKFLMIKYSGGLKNFKMGLIRDKNKNLYTRSCMPKKNIYNILYILLVKFASYKNPKFEWITAALTKPKDCRGLRSGHSSAVIMKWFYYIFSLPLYFSNILM